MVRLSFRLERIIGFEAGLELGMGLEAYTLLVKLQLLADDPAQCPLEVPILLLHILAQSAVDKRLVVAATSSVYLMAKPVENIGVDPDGDARFAVGRPHHAPCRASSKPDSLSFSRKNYL